MPQVSTALQLSEIEPQFFPWAVQVVGVQVFPVPQTLATPPPPQVSEARQLPHLITAPHPSGKEPQSFPAFLQVLGVQIEPSAFPLEPPSPHALAQKIAAPNIVVRFMLCIPTW